MCSSGELLISGFLLWFVDESLLIVLNMSLFTNYSLLLVGQSNTNPMRGHSSRGLKIRWKPLAQGKLGSVEIAGFKV